MSDWALPLCSAAWLKAPTSRSSIKRHFGRWPAAYRQNLNKAKQSAMGMMLPNIVRAPNMGMWTFDVKANIVHGDEILALYFGVENRAAAEGLPIQVFFDAIHQDDLARVQDEIARTYAGLGTFLSEYRVLGRDGKWRRILATGRCFYHNDEPIQYPGFVVEVESIADRAKEALDELSDSVIKARKAAEADSRDFVSYLLDMVLLEVGRALASRQVARLMPKDGARDYLS